ncbi:MAG: alpha/beta hydrolase [Chloroflexi bacterium HGW-Chloroflexi-4]|jgi:pimeloyl-ACP methyl ester carboxylesterase|nr:MAG: alpha/beta hydrolase [Chloroflexi bacterium HGW-Chloroflexi-4]
MDIIQGDVIANGVKLHFYRTGGSKPPIVLLHGVTDDGLCWLRTAEVLAEDYDVVMVDMRGHGKSMAPEEGYTLIVMAGEIVALIKELGLLKPIIMGHSMGAITTLTLAGLYPEVAKAIVLEDPPPFWIIKSTDKSEPPNPNPLAQWISANKRKTKEDLLHEVRVGNPGWDESEIEPWVNSKLRYSPKIGSMVAMDDLPATDFENLVKKITCPALMITADLVKGAIVGEKEASALKQGVPQLEVVHITGAGHNIRRDQFEPYMKAVQTFLTNNA